MGNYELGSPKADETWKTELFDIFAIYNLKEETENRHLAMQVFWLAVLSQ